MPGRHGQQVRVIGHDEHGAYFSGEIQDRVVLVVGAIVHRTGYLCQQPSAAMLGCLREDRDVSIDLRALKRMPRAMRRW